MTHPIAKQRSSALMATRAFIMAMVVDEEVE